MILPYEDKTWTTTGSISSASGGTVTGGGGSWNSQAYTDQSYSNAFVKFKASQTNENVQFGLDSNPTQNASYYNLDFRFYVRSYANMWATREYTQPGGTSTTTYYSTVSNGGNSWSSSSGSGSLVNYSTSMEFLITYSFGLARWWYRVNSASSWVLMAHYKHTGASAYEGNSYHVDSSWHDYGTINSIEFGPFIG